MCNLGEKMNMAKRTLLLTIKQIYAERILVGSQSTEHRTRPPNLSHPTRTILYVSGIQQIIGECTMDPVCGERTHWGYPLPVHDPIQYIQPLSWKSIHENIPGIKPPHQSFRYLKPENDEDSRLLELLNQYRREAV
jgi:predicted transcriptional regulator